jgi:hypothetical protein
VAALTQTLGRNHPLAGDLSRCADRIDAIRRRGTARPGLISDLTQADSLAHFLADALAYERNSLTSRKDRGAVRVVPTAGLLAAAAARLLPPGERAGYADEFRSELWEIAQASGCRRSQLAYAARQLLAARRLRAELRVPRRRGAAP